MNAVIACKVLIVCQGQALILQRSDSHPHHPLHNDLPGGIIEDGESLRVGLEREILEEIGIKLSVAESNLRYSQTVYVEKTRTSYIHSIFVYNTDEIPNVVLSWEHVTYTWKVLGDITDLDVNYQRGLDYILEHQLIAT